MTTRLATTVLTTLAFALLQPGCASALPARLPAGTSSAQTTPARSGLTISVRTDGYFEVDSAQPQWKFSGSVPTTVADIETLSAKDGGGAYQEVSFSYRLNGTARASAIRAYDDKPVVLFRSVFLESGTNSDPFPVLSEVPSLPHHLSYTTTFGGFSFQKLGTDGPWVYFDDQARTFILSPASHFMNAKLSLNNGKITSGIETTTGVLPSGYTQWTALVVEPGINRAFETWGNFLTDFAGKTRPANDADFGLNKIGYWTDHGAVYYYRFDKKLGYADTLREMRDEFAKLGIGLGYIQLDSWFYRKGHEGSWESGDPQGGGTYLYEPDTKLFPDGLDAFHDEVDVPFITHNRWIDATSPYRQTYAMSGNVSTDPRLWNKWMSDLQSWDVGTYEQDWLAGPAIPVRDLNSGEEFMDNMASAAANRGLTMQYCMPLPRHFLQATKYSNLMTIRTSGDHFEKGKWEEFLFDGRLASALGEWPWTDVYMSSETSNLLISTLSASMVGIGDGEGQINAANVLRSVRPDGVIVKPDTSLTPLDSVYLDRARGGEAPMVAVARTDHGSGLVTSYLFAFTRNGEQGFAVDPSELGYMGAVYVYDYFAKAGSYLKAGTPISGRATTDGDYLIVVPVGASGTAFLGDETRFVSNGKKRIAALADNGTASVQVLFGAGESVVSLHGFSERQPRIAVEGGATIQGFKYDISTKLFRFDLAGKPANTVAISIGP